MKPLSWRLEGRVNKRELRKLDQQISEKIFGCKTLFKLSPAYSTNIDLAWKIIEKYLENDFIVNIHLEKANPILGENAPTAWIDIANKQFYLIQSNRFKIEVSAKTLPLAICQAALK